MPVHVIKTFRGGISDENDKGVEGAFKHGHAIDIHARDDSLTAKQAMLNIAPSGMSDLVQFMVPATDGSVYCFGNSGSIWAKSGSEQDPVWTEVYSDENGAIKGAEEFKFDDDTGYLFWATDTAIARKRFPGDDATPWADVTAVHKTEGIDSRDWHTMKVAAGKLMIANGEHLMSFDFDGSFTQSALNIRPGNFIKALEERDDNVVLGSTRQDLAEEGYIWSWVTTALNWVQKKRIPVAGINALISTEFFLAQGGVDGELFTSDFISSVPLHGIPGGGQVNPGGVTIEDGVALFGTFGGTYPGIWSYGRKRKNRPLALNFPYRLSPTVDGSTVTEVGALSMHSSTLFASWETIDGSTSDFGVDQISSSTKATYLYEGLEFDNDQPFAKRMHNFIKIGTKPMDSGTSISAKFKLDNEDDWRYAVMGDGETTHAVAAGNSSTEAMFAIGKSGPIYEVGIEGNPSGNNSPGVLSISTDLGDEEYEYG